MEAHTAAADSRFRVGARSDRNTEGPPGGWSLSMATKRAEPARFVTSGRPRSLLVGEEKSHGAVGRDGRHIRLTPDLGDQLAPVEWVGSGASDEQREGRKPPPPADAPLPLPALRDGSTVGCPRLKAATDGVWCVTRNGIAPAGRGGIRR